MVIANSPLRDSTRLLEIAKNHQFEVLRDDARGRIIKKGTMRFVLPVDGEEANKVTSEAIINICTDLDIRANKGKPPKHPLQVSWNGETWAVFSANAGQYQLQSLVDGHRVWVDKYQTQEVEVVNGNGSTPPPTTPVREPEPDPAALERMAARALPPVAAFKPEQEAPVVERAEPETEGPKLQVHEATDFSELSPLAYSRNEMKRQIERTQIRIEAEEAKLKPLYDQLAAFQAAYAALAGGIAAASTPQSPRRTVLPPVGPGGRTARGEAVASSQRGVPKKRLSYDDRKAIRDLLNQGKEPKEIIRVLGDHIQYHHISAQRDAIAQGRELHT